MFISDIKLTNFKNHTHKHLFFSQKVNCFYGLNGAGKTNILDAIQYISSFKNINQLTDTALVNESSDFFRLDCTINNSNKIIIKYIHNKKTIEYNEEKIKKISSIFGHVPMVISSPNDIFFLYGGSEERRKFIDYTISIYDKAYLEKLLIYNKYLDQRNAYLKKEELLNSELIEFYDQKLIENGEYIFMKRNEFSLKLTDFVNKWYETISSNHDAIEIKYESKLAHINFQTLLKNSFEKDKILKRTTQGIHRDDLECYLKSIDLKKIGSQGQQKTFLYALKIAQAEFLYEMTSKKIIFLLDDFSDKLDISRQTNLQELINKNTFISQWFITDTDKKCFDMIDTKEIFEIK